MFNKIAAWLRSIVAGEVSKVSTSLQQERDSITTLIASFEEKINTHSQSQSEALSKLSEISVDGEIQRLSKENTEQRATIKTLIEKSAGIIAKIKQLHPELNI